MSFQLAGVKWKDNFFPSNAERDKVVALAEAVFQLILSDSRTPSEIRAIGSCIDSLASQTALRDPLTRPRDEPFDFKGVFEEHLKAAFQNHYEWGIAQVLECEDVREYMEKAAPWFIAEERRLEPWTDIPVIESVSTPVLYLELEVQTYLGHEAVHAASHPDKGCRHAHGVSKFGGG